jgi:hypothetical protein
MNPGRELDALIAEKVMGIKMPAIPINGATYQEWAAISKASHEAVSPPCYSTEIAAAWQVVEKIKDMVKGTDGTFKIQWCEPVWICYWDHEDFLSNPGYAQADTAPHAICLAALKAVSP